MASIDDILELIDSGADADHLVGASILLHSPDLHALGASEHGSWEATLAAALLYVRRSSTEEARPASAAPERPDVPRPARTVGPAAHVAVHVISKGGLLLNLELDALKANATPTLQPFPTGPGREHGPAQLVLGGDDPGLVIVTNTGNGLGVDSRLLPAWAFDAVTRPLSARFGDLLPDEVVSAAMPRRPLRDADRLFSVSVLGQLKATDTPEYRKLSADAMTAVLFREGDAPQSIFVGSRRSKVLVASSGAKAIVFDTSEVRSQGRKATGVRAIALENDATVIGAFAVDDVEWICLATEQGYFKRMRTEEFRPQGRGGGGLQTCRLSPGDHVASVAAASIDGDVVVLTNRGRFARFPVYDLPFVGRAARGERVLELGEGESVAQVLGVAAGNWGGT